MDVINTFGSVLQKELRRDPDRARKMLLTGFRAYGTWQHVHPDRRLAPSQDYAADLSMNTMVRALAHPEKSAMCSLFVPGEPLVCADVTPYSVEAFSSFISGTHIEKVFLNITEEKGFPQTMCSFHRVFLGAAESGLLPTPPFMVYTSLACDANLLTFPYIKRKRQMPSFFIDVPYDRNEESVQDVARQLRNLTEFLQDMTHRKITDEQLTRTMMRSNRSVSNYQRAQQILRSRDLPTHMTCDMYGVFTSRFLMGTKETEKYTKLLLKDAECAFKSNPESRKLRIAWIHVMPFMQPSMRKLFNFSGQVYFTGCDIVDDGFQKGNPNKPYDMMARRLVYSAYNGPAEGRIEAARRLIRDTQAEGAVVFTHWGCKTTLGASGLIRDALEADGIPTIVLDGDGCDPSNSSDGQMTTRMEAFIEMLKEKRQ